MKLYVKKSLRLSKIIKPKIKSMMAMVSEMVIFFVLSIFSTMLKSFF